MACEGKKKVRLIVTSDGKDTAFLFDTAPITVSCKNNKHSGLPCSNYSVTYEYDLYQYDEVTFARVAGNTFDNAGKVTAIRTVNNKTLEILREVCSNGIYQNAMEWYLLASSPYATIRNPRLTNVVLINTPTSSPNPKNRGIVVRDKFGKILIDDNSLECNYEIICDDDCAEGSHKCTHNQYPGYCCVPCKDVGDKLKNMANKVGG